MLTRTITIILAIACGAIVANIYYAQTIVALIGEHLQISTEASGLIVTLTQIGYALGLLFIVPLADLLENRKLILTLIGLLIICLGCIITIHHALLFFTFCFLLGLSSVATQIIIPYAAHLSNAHERGKVVGDVVSGLFFGIMLARPLASWFADLFAWHAVFVFSLIIMILLAIVLRWRIPKRMPEATLSYRQLLQSMPVIFKTHRILRRRAAYHAVLFGVFSLFWTSIAMLLMSDIFNYTQAHVGLFAFVGTAGAIASPFAGRLADRGWTKFGTGAVIVLAFVAGLLAKFGAHSIVALVAAAILLDMSVSANFVLGQRALFMLSADIRARLNSMYMTIFFTGAAIGSALASYLYAKGGWAYITDLWLFLTALIFIYFLSD